ncbi:MAG: P1 family peptidase, partial [Chloroflexota bacterium]
MNGRITDVPGITIGCWTDPVGLTGCTVVLCPDGAVVAADVRGGAPGTRDTELARPGMLVERAHAVLLTGGSAYGLDAAGGVMRWLEERGQGFSLGGRVVP